MKIFIISPSNIALKKSQSSKRKFFPGRNFRTTIFPLEIVTLAPVLINSGHRVKILDCLLEDRDLESVINEVEIFQPDFILFAPFDRCRWGLEGAVSIASHIKGGRVVFFGSYLKELAIWVMKNNRRIDAFACGDPEEVISELISGEKEESIKGLIFRRGEEIIENEMRPPIDVNSLPMADRDLLKMEYYKKLPHTAVKEPCIDVLTSRGCPYNCAFCLLNVVGGRNYRLRSSEKVIEEIRLVKERYRAKQINFGSLNFTVNKEWVKSLCHLLIKEDLGVVWSCQTRTDLVDREILELMKKAGCVSVLYGIESFSQELLDNVNKMMDVEHNYQAVNLTKDIGIETRLSMMLGLPGETPEIAKKMVSELIKLEPDFVQFHSTIAFPFTELYQKRDKWGEVSEINDRSFDISGHPFLPKGYRDKDELKKVISEAYRRFYLRPKYIIKKVSHLNNWKRYAKGILVLLKLL